MTVHTEVLPVDPQHPDPSVIAYAADVLSQGELVAFPTETVYGLGGCADRSDTITKIYQAKGRPAHNPLIVHVASIEQARSLCPQWSDDAQRLAEKFWPGPLTLVVARPKVIPAIVSAGLDTMALRIPRHPVALALIAKLGRPVAAPSANPSTKLSPTTAEHVRKGLNGKIKLILDGGPTVHGIESTVVDTLQHPPRVLRYGAITLDTLSTVIPDMLLPAEHKTEPSRSPGMDLLHYSPNAKLTITNSEQMAITVDNLVSQGRTVGVVQYQPVLSHGENTSQTVRLKLVTLVNDPEIYAAKLFQVLHELDDLGCDFIVVQRVPQDTAWLAIADRLKRASMK